MSAVPTKGMREEAQRYRNWKQEGRKGGTEVAARRASQILSGNELSDSTIITISAWFARHEVDKQGEGFNPGSPSYPSPGRVAWAAWGGDPGKAWADRLASAMDRSMNSEDNARPYPNEHAARLHDPAQYDSFRRRNDAAGKGVDFIFGIKEGQEGAELQAIRFKLSEFTATEARTWLKNHDYTPLSFEEATGKRHSRELTPDVTSTQAALYDALEEIVEDLGPFDQGSGAHGAHYMANNPFVSEGMQCSNCLFYVGPRACEVVTGDIAPEALCKFWIIPEQLLTSSASEDAAPMDTSTESPSAGTRASASELSTGDYVSWNSSGGMARGQIEHIMREGTLGVPDSEFSIDATKEDPAALIRIFRESQGAWAPTETLVGHRFSTLRKISALRSHSGTQMKRSEATEFRALGERVMEFPFSSEYPVQRYFGNEVLSHEGTSAALGRLNDGAPLLFNHDPDRVIGVVEKAYVDEKMKRGYAKVRFSRNKYAQEVLDDVRDGILRGVSFGYSIDDMQERNGDMVVTKWSPYELSIVAIPADPTIGVGRSLLDTQVMQVEESKIEVDSTTSASAEVRTQAAPAASPLPDPMENTTPDMEVIRSKAAEAERTRISAINALGSKHQMQDLARELIDGGRSLDEARAAVLDKLGQAPMEQPIDQTSNDLGLSDKETRSFSFVRALNYLANPSDASSRRSAEFEIEVGKAAAAKYERSSNGIVIPNEVLRRDLVVGTPSAGGNLVADELLSGSFIDLLRNRLALAQAGVTMLSGLQGNISIPRQTSGSTGYWVGENVAPAESQQAIDQVNMTPKTLGAFIDYSRRLLLQSSIDVEGMIRNDLARVIALELDRAAIYGTGSSNQPLGLTNTTGIGSQTITTFGTFAEYIGMETDVATANADAGSLRYIVNAAARGALKSTAKSSSAVAAGFVYENNEINGYPAIVSNQLASNDALFGDFSMMIMGMWSGLDLTVDPYAGATAGTVRIIALQDVDVAVKQPGAFCLGT